MDDFSFYAPWETVLVRLKESIRAEQVFCSLVTEMEELPAFQSQPALSTVHKENYETSYHRNTAAGNLMRLCGMVGSHGPVDIKRLVLLTVDCFVEAREHDKRAEQALLTLTTQDAYASALLAMAVKWHKLRKKWLKRAARTLRSFIPPELWQEGVSKANVG